MTKPKPKNVTPFNPNTNKFEKPDNATVWAIVRFIADSEHSTTIKKIAQGLKLNKNWVQAHVLWLFKAKVLYLYRADAFNFPENSLTARWFTNPNLREFTYWILNKQCPTFDADAYMQGLSNSDINTRTF